MDAQLEQRIQYLERLLSEKTRSPLVVQLASLYLEAGRPHDALRYCDDAIAHFPYYTTAHLVRARVLHALEMNAEARREFDFVHSVLPDVETVKNMLQQIPASETETFEETEPAHGASSQVAESIEPDGGSETGTLDEVKSQESLDPPTGAGDEPADKFPVETIQEEPATESADQKEAVKESEGTQEIIAEEDAESSPDGDPFGLRTAEEDASTVDVEGEVEAQMPPIQEESTEKANTFGDLESEPVVSQEPEPEGEVSGGDEGYQEYAKSMSGELSGTENTMTIDEFLSSQAETDEPQIDHIEDLAEKLKDTPKITPVIDLTEKKAPPPSEEDTPASTGFVTPTLAEIYAKQGWYDDAIVAYKTLARIKPAEREKFEKRIQELEEKKRSEEETT
jgi:tetratricopeptide (TPR) repeat protein